MRVLAILAFVLLALSICRAQEETVNLDSDNLPPEILEQLKAMQAQGIETEVIEEPAGGSREPEESAGSPFAATSYVFPKNADYAFNGGDVAEVLIGLKNSGSVPFNITSVVASLNYPFNHRYYIQNFTRAFYEVSVNPARESTIAYYFRPDPLLETAVFSLVLIVSYGDDTRNYTTTVFNRTVQINEPAAGFDSQSFFLMVGTLASLGFGGYVVYGRVSSSRSWKRKPAVETGTDTSSTEVKSEWLDGVNLGNTQKKQTSGKKKGPKGKSK
eukprot:TRINITY_DN49784_c0_g2_i1.p1 TRINITY_DN49784_c0_g2~~TRINITY_DN49784_c0_g2_i1.p1  ORF type:complete len:272 (-),score=71.34 TRINITY_DN49784_c0_g2_i1:60-875(-)